MLLYKLYDSKKSIKHLNFRMEKKNEQIVSLKTLFHKLESSKMAADRIEGSEFNGNIYEITKNIEPTLIFRIHENNCNDCVEKALLKLEEIKKQKKINIIVLAKYPSLPNVLQKFEIHFPIYIYGDFKQDSIANTKPYFFVLKNGKMENIFFPDWEMPELLSNYIDCLKEL